MALIIKADMPTCCDKCFFNLRCPVYARQVQKIWESKHEQVFDVFGEMRLADCPLVEIPDEHGRLVDRAKVFEIVDAYISAYGSDDPSIRKMLSQLAGDITDLDVVVEASK